ncbi:hypothetical protein [Caulobacter sp. Root343]|uniref:hypothetical protein n=2 Tax=unclassified Caulobacter TaxID=2648921 RepID=UPI000A92814C|nr:hypothetical protein [Caulobacter sp. Root343]
MSKTLSSWLSLAAAPTFAILALWTLVFGDRDAAMICSGGRGGPISGMAVMYLLMAAFHLPCWLGRPTGPLRACGAPPPEGEEGVAPTFRPLRGRTAAKRPGGGK